ncbi:acetylcholinesterase-like [Haliotis rufescens]|uniref:acetylcholinesterase-like n=1 Tax=Haliotis rufescens TaxID=6454 RepID=UPI00201EEE23|nr:acetylcholinesterase-like [Haliotis rufescens]
MALLAALLSLASLTRLAAATTVTVNVPALGDIVGIARTDTNAFLGIKYASAPRFEDPQPVSPWPNPYDATNVGAACYQNCPNIPELACQEDISEDCLFLNIFTPSGNPPGTCVMFFLHGGNFDAYSGGSIVFDGDVFVNEGGCILVTINYRLTAFGFLGSRNLGVKDQIAALEWIHTYIQYFGGDNTKITAFGQSAGAQSTALLMSVPSASQYLNRAILQSCPFTLPFRTAAQGDSQEAQLATLMGCTVGNLTCYREADADDILKLQHEVELPDAPFLMPFEFWGPVIDKGLVMDHLYNIFSRGLHKKMDTIIGTVQDEAMGYVYSMSPSPLSTHELRDLLHKISPILSPELLSLVYDVDGDDDKRYVLAEIGTDYLFRCVGQSVAKRMSRDAVVYSYVFDQKFPYNIWGDGNICNDYVCHGVELPTVFGTFGLLNRTLPHEQMSLSDDVIQYWNNFARDGRPWSEDSSLLTWTSFKTRQQKFLLLKAGSTYMKSDPAGSLKCSILEHFLGFNPR